MDQYHLHLKSRDEKLLKSPIISVDPPSRQSKRTKSMYENETNVSATYDWSGKVT